MRISLVHSVCVPRDGISDVIRCQLLWLQEQGIEVRLYCYQCEFPELPYTVALSVTDVLRDAFYQQSDLVIYHYGVYHDLFNLIYLPPRQARAIVAYHNVTPVHLHPPKDRNLARLSWAQQSNAIQADYLLCDSPENLNVLRRLGVRAPGSILPICFHAEATAPTTKPSFDDGILRVCFLGRMVLSKGVPDLLELVRELSRRHLDQQIEVRLAGNTRFSNPDVVRRIQELEAFLERDPETSIRCWLLDSPSNEERDCMLKDSDVLILPTYHEGFCIPVLEAMAAGCRVISYRNSNLPFISGGLVSLVPTGDTEALTRSFLEIAADTATETWRTSGYSEYIQSTRNHLERFRPQPVREHFLRIVKSLSPVSC